MHIEVPRPAPRSPLHIRYTTGLLFAAVIAVTLGAQDKPTSQQPTFRTGVNYVRVDVYPTVNGRPVADLSRDDFEILENGAPQTIDGFEHIVVRPRDIAVEPDEPRNVREANQMAADARHRLFVIYLDTYHVTEASTMHDGSMRVPGSTTTRAPGRENPLGTRNIDRALTTFLDRAIGPDDLFAALTPDMDPEQLTFSRRPETFEQLVRTVWGRRFSYDDMDPDEERWALCYPPDDLFHCYDGILLDMVRRHREDVTLQFLRRLVTRLGEVREERKALILVSEGWALYRPNQQLARPVPRVPIQGCGAKAVPEGKGIYIGTDGKLKMGTDPRTFMTVDWQECEASRSQIAHADNDRSYRALLDEANRTNTSFYPVDPRGLAVFATPIDYKDLPQTPQNLATQPADKEPEADARDLRSRLETLRSLATATDGKMTETNDLKGGLKKIADDLSDYYLLAYYSTNAKADGTFRKISVRVKRPGVEVRARRGYLAPTEAELAARRAASASVDAESSSRAAALATLGTIRADRPVHLAAGVAWSAPSAGGPSRPLVWVAGEIDLSMAREAPWNAGADASVTLAPSGAEAIATERRALGYDARTFLLRLTPDLAPGEYMVRARVQGKAGAGAEASMQVRVQVPEASDTAVLGQPLLYRRGPFSGAGFQPTADLRFRKAERLRVDVPAKVSFEAVSACLLDRVGAPLAIPVNASALEEDGVRFVRADVSLAPLALGDYLLEVSARTGATQEKSLTAFRIVP